MIRWLVSVSVLLAIRPAVAGPAEDPAAMACHPAAGKVRAQFAPDVGVRDLVVWMVGFSCKSVVLGTGVEQAAHRTVTVMAPSELTPKQAMQLFVDAVEAAGFVVIQKPDTVIIKLGPDALPACSGGLPSPSLAALDTGIHKIDDTHVRLTRDAIDVLVANPMAGADVRIVPRLVDARIAGYALYAIGPTSVYGRLGLASGDVVEAIAGVELTGADKLEEIYAKARTARSIDVRLVRGGQPLTLTYSVTPLPF